MGTGESWVTGIQTSKLHSLDGLISETDRSGGLLADLGDLKLDLATGPGIG